MRAILALIIIFVIGGVLILSFSGSNNFVQTSQTPVSSSMPSPDESVEPEQPASSSNTPKPVSSAKPTTSTSQGGAGLPAQSGWILTVYYTPVQSYHGGPEESISGCPTEDCDNPQSLGSYPKSFLDLIATEGVGKITSGQYAGKYMHYTDDTGYWLSPAPLDAQGKPLVKFITAAVPSNVAKGTRIEITACGTAEGSNKPVPEVVCSAIKSSRWVATDEFYNDPKNKHIDLYIGEEDRENYLNTNPYVFASYNASVKLY